MNLNLDDGGIYQFVPNNNDALLCIFTKFISIHFCSFPIIADVAGLALNAQSRVELMQKLARDTDLIAPTAQPVMTEPLVS